MAPGPWLFVNSLRTNVLNGTFDFDTDSFKVALLTSASNIGAGSTTFAGVTGEVAAANGYAAGGVAVSCTIAGSPNPIVDFAANPTWTANGGSIVARFACLYEVGGNVVAYCLLDSTPADVMVNDGNMLTLDPPAGGVFSAA